MSYAIFRVQPINKLKDLGQIVVWILFMKILGMKAGKY